MYHIHQMMLSDESKSFIVTLPKTDLSSEMNDVVREPSLDSHFTDSTKPKIVLRYEAI